MFSPLMRDLMRASHPEIIGALKRSDGMPVSDLARELKMSYMGVKQHCVKLTKLGYLVERRLPKAERAVGRPEKIYRLTKKCDELFPRADGEVTTALLGAVQDLYGAAAPERLLLNYLNGLEEKWAVKLKKVRSAAEKAARLVELREAEGWFSRCEIDAKEGFRIEEFHSPLAELQEKYPNLVRLETRLMERLLGAKVTREERILPKGGKRTVWLVNLLGAAGGKEPEKLAPVEKPLRVAVEKPVEKEDSEDGQEMLF